MAKTEKKASVGTGHKDGADAQAAFEKLQAYGERFMSMFDDYEDKKKAAKASTSGRRKAGSAGAKTPGTGGEGRGPSGPSTGTATKIPAKSTGSAAPAAAQPGTPGKRKSPGTAPQPSASPGGSAGTPDGRKRQRSAASEIDAIMQQKVKRTKGGEAAHKPAGAPAAAAAAAAAIAAKQAEAMKRERKLFMSSKASKVYEAVKEAGTGPSGGRRGAAREAVEVDAALSPAEFARLQLEVEKFSASALDKKAARVHRARVLERLGAKAEAAPRRTAAIGHGMAKAAAKREARALEEAIESGMVQRKGLGKKRRAAQGKKFDRGLMEAGRGFKNGVLRIKPLKKERGGGGGKLRLPKGVL